MPSPEGSPSKRLPVVTDCPQFARTISKISRSDDAVAVQISGYRRNGNVFIRPHVDPVSENPWVTVDIERNRLGGIPVTIEIMHIFRQQSVVSGVDGRRIGAKA